MTTGTGFQQITALKVLYAFGIVFWVIPLTLRDFYIYFLLEGLNLKNKSKDQIKLE